MSTQKKKQKKSSPEKKTPNHTAGSFRVREATTIEEDHHHKKNDALLIFLGFIVGATLIGFIVTAMSAQKKNYDAIPTTQDERESQEPIADSGDVGSDTGNIEEAMDAAMLAELNGTTTQDTDVTDTTNTITQDQTDKNPSAVQENDTRNQQESTNSTQETTTAPSVRKTTGKWYLVDYNNEQFNLDDQDDDVTEITFDHVCGGVNRGITTYCKNATKLRKTTSESLGNKYCGRGSSCRIGESCLLWNAVEEDDGDVEMKTAVYTCA